MKLLFSLVKKIQYIMAYLMCPQCDKKCTILFLISMFSMYTAFGPGGAIPTRVNYISRLHELGDGCRNMPNTNGKNYPSMVTLCRVCAESYSRNRIRIRKEVRNQAQIAVRMYSKYVERGEPNPEYYFRKYEKQEGCIGSANTTECRYRACKIVSEKARTHRNWFDLAVSWISHPDAVWNKEL